MQQKLWQGILEYARIEWDTTHMEVEKATNYNVAMINTISSREATNSPATKTTPKPCIGTFKHLMWALLVMISLFMHLWLYWFHQVHLTETTHLFVHVLQMH